MAGSNVKSLSVNATGDTTVVTGEGVYYGFTVRETAGSAATVQIYNNTAASGKLLDTFQLTANESRSDYYGPQGIHYNTGIFFHVAVGTIEGSVRVG